MTAAKKGGKGGGNKKGPGSLMDVPKPAGAAQQPKAGGGGKEPWQETKASTGMAGLLQGAFAWLAAAL